MITRVLCNHFSHLLSVFWQMCDPSSPLPSPLGRAICRTSTSETFLRVLAVASVCCGLDSVLCGGLQAMEWAFPLCCCPCRQHFVLWGGPWGSLQRGWAEFASPLPSPPVSGPDGEGQTARVCGQAHVPQGGWGKGTRGGTGGGIKSELLYPF